MHWQELLQIKTAGTRANLPSGNLFALQIAWIYFDTHIYTHLTGNSPCLSLRILPTSMITGSLVHFEFLHLASERRWKQTVMLVKHSAEVGGFEFSSCPFMLLYMYCHYSFVAHIFFSLYIRVSNKYFIAISLLMPLCCHDCPSDASLLLHLAYFLPMYSHICHL